MTEEEAKVVVMKKLGANVRSAISLTENVRVRHHAIARLIAAGRRKSEIHQIMGVSQGTLSILERSPAFQALVLEYMNMMDKQSIESYTRLKIVGNLRLDELTDRLTTAPKSIKTSEVLELVKLAADRTGMGPTSKQVTLNGRISPADLRAIKSAQGMSPAENAGETADGGTGGEAGVCLELEIDTDAEDGEEFRALAHEMVTPADEVTDLITDLGEIFRPAR